MEKIEKSSSRKWQLMKWSFAIGTLIQLIAMFCNKPYPVEFFTFLGAVSSMYFGANSACKFTQTSPVKGMTCSQGDGRS